jgi:2-amino-4-hydroxy-6-hydroxymethyldihydropteridine diphosphokinase
MRHSHGLKTRATSMVTAYIAFGSNLGDREAHIRAALAKIGRTPGVRVSAISSFLENPAVGMGENAPAFLNGVIAVETTMEPRALLDRLLHIERDLGRERSDKWSPRTIDLDLLLHGDRVIDEEGLTIPHPRMHERRFVLAPLAEIAPDALHPILRRSMRDLLDNQ